jgi:nitrous oxidase accessory protein NosD
VSAPNYVDTVNYTASVDEFMQSSFSVYPNPADNYIVLQNAIVGDKVVLFDVVGKKVKSFNVESESQQMDISELKTGVYFARSNQQEAIKIIKR